MLRRFGWFAVVLAVASCEVQTNEVAQAVVVEPLAEVDVANLGGTPSSTVLPFVVTAGATGTDGRLTSWKLPAPAAAPVFLRDSPVIPGSHHQVRALMPRAGSPAAHQMLVSASIAAGKLAVHTWRVADDGTFTSLGLASYGPAGVTVLDYAIAHRELEITSSVKRFQLVTPITRAGGNLRVVTWEIDAISGAITLREASADLPASAAGDPQVSVAFVPGGPALDMHYAVSLSNTLGQIHNSLWNVDAFGHPVLRGLKASGMDLDNVFMVTRNATTLASAPLTRSGFVTVGDSGGQADTSGELQVWEDVTIPCAVGDCTLVPLNVSNSTRDITPAVPGVQQAGGPGIASARGALRDAAYELEPYTWNGDSIQAIASVRKVMITIVTLDLVEAGTISLDATITVSKAAAAVASNGVASNMGLVEGEQIKLRELLYGMMMVSAGDAAWAISEYVGNNVTNMVTLMNAKAGGLGLTNTLYCHDKGDSNFSSVGYSTARDQAKLWASAHADPLFLDVVGKASALVCGQRKDHTQICHSSPLMTKNMTWAVGLDGWKGGNGGGSCATYSLLYPPCASCQTAQATRLGRPLVATSLEAFTLNLGFSDGRKVLDWGYRQVFTPDFRGDSGGVGGAATDFGLDVISDTFAVTAVLPATGVRLCNWSVDAGAGTFAKLACTAHDVLGVTPGGTPAIPRRVAIAPLSDLEADADYLVGRVTAGALKLSAWRVGQRD